MLEIDSQDEHLIILRRHEGHASFVLQYAPQPRQLSDSELVEKAKELEEKTDFGDEKAFFKLYSSSIATVFYFENPDPKKTLQAEFKL